MGGLIRFVIFTCARFARRYDDPRALSALSTKNFGRRQNGPSGAFGALAKQKTFVILEGENSKRLILNV